MRFTNYPTVHHQPAEQFAVGRAKRAPYFPPDPQRIQLGGFVASLPPVAHAISDRSIMPVCYGGSFAARRESFNLTSRRVWRLLQRALERGDNIQEGSHVERLWAALLMRPLRRREEEVIEEFAAKDDLSTELRVLPGWAWSGMLNSCGCGDFEVPRLDAASAKADSGFGSGLSGKVYLLQGGGSGPLGVFSPACKDTSALQAGRGCKKKKVRAVRALRSYDS